MKYKKVSVFKAVLGLVSKYWYLYLFVRSKRFSRSRFFGGRQLEEFFPLQRLGGALEDFLQQRPFSWRKTYNMPLL